jgi:hypothetical protein
MPQKNAPSTASKLRHPLLMGASSSTAREGQGRRIRATTASDEAAKHLLPRVEQVIKQVSGADPGGDRSNSKAR